MFSKKIAMVCLALSAFALGCQKKYLDTNPTDKIAPDVIFETTQSARVALNGMHRFMNTVPCVFANTDNHYDFGQKTIDIISDVMGNDMVNLDIGYNWYRWLYKYQNSRNPTAGELILVWNFYYKIINNANNILANIDNAQGAQKDKDEIKGQAYVYRAWAYFGLIQFYQFTYKGHESAPGVPISTTATISTTPSNKRASVQEVYTQITKDLDAALVLLPGGGLRGDKSQLDGSVAKGVYARVALVMNDWEKAATMAREARTGYKLMSVSEYGAGFKLTNDEWMWNSNISEEQCNSMNILSFFSHMDITAAGYAGAGAFRCMTKELYDKIPDGDVRKTLFADEETATANEIPEYTQLKFRLESTSSWFSNLIYMRAGEMYLIEAEAQAHGASGNAQATLEELVKARFPAYTVPAGGQALLDEIYLQRRIELWGEGFSFTDIHRLKTGLNRPTGPGNHEPAATGGILKLDANSPSLLFKIPQSEMDANKAFTAADQNP